LGQAPAARYFWGIRPIRHSLTLRLAIGDDSVKHLAKEVHLRWGSFPLQFIPTTQNLMLFGLICSPLLRLNSATATTTSVMPSEIRLIQRRFIIKALMPGVTILTLEKLAVDSLNWRESAAVQVSGTLPHIQMMAPLFKTAPYRMFFNLGCQKKEPFESSRPKGLHPAYLAQ
jgi:hypothetical protein